MFAANGDGNKSERFTSTSTSTSVQGSQPCRYIKYPEILLATKNFDESLVIGHGGFGKVYKGSIFDGSTRVDAAIKRLDSVSNQGEHEFWAEVDTLSTLRHCNLVSLIGYCNYEKEMILVYEYMPNGTLEDHLHKLRTPLSWIQRLKICIGAGRGLHYLHTGTGIEFGIIHRDVKTSNILLHESWAAKISDFGLSKTGPTNQTSSYVNTLVKGTFGYLDPDYYATGKLTRKSDVYAFGVVLLEVLCRKRAVDRSLDEEQWNLARWAQESIKDGNLKKIIDSDIRDEISPKCLREFVRIAERCLHSNLKQRSTMAEVVVCLESVLTLQEKYNNSLQAEGRTIFGRMLDMLSIPINRDSAYEETKFSPQTRSPASGSRVAKVVTGPLRPEVVDLSLPLPLPPNSPTTPPAAFPRWKRGRLLGRGTLGHVYLGFNSEYGQMCAIKEIKAVADDQLSKESLKLLSQEITLLSNLSHPNIVQYYGTEVGEEMISVCMEYVSGGSITKLLREYGPFKEPIIQSYTRQVLRGLAYLHGRNIVHRGLKGANILVDAHCEIKLTDFGMAKHIANCSSMPSFKGSLYWTAPEVVMNANGYNLAVDIWSLGCTILEMATLRPPWSQYDEVALIFKVRNSKEFPEIPDHLSNDAKSFIKHCLQRDPSLRPTALQLLEHPFVRDQTTRVADFNLIEEVFPCVFNESHTLEHSLVRGDSI